MHLPKAMYAVVGSCRERFSVVDLHEKSRDFEHLLCWKFVWYARKFFGKGPQISKRMQSVMYFSLLLTTHGLMNSVNTQNQYMYQCISWMWNLYVVYPATNLRPRFHYGWQLNMALKLSPHQHIIMSHNVKMPLHLSADWLITFHPLSNLQLSYMLKTQKQTTLSNFISQAFAKSWFLLLLSWGSWLCLQQCKS